MTSKPTSSTTEQRRRSTASALASVKAEGLVPSAATKRRLELYVQGKITAKQLEAETLAEIQGKTTSTHVRS